MTLEDAIKLIEYNIEQLERRVQVVQTDSWLETWLEGQVVAYRDCLSLVGEIAL